MEDRSKCSSNDGSSSKENCIILGKLIYSLEHLDSLMCLIVTNFVNDMNLKLDKRKVVIETEMMPLKCINEKYRSSIAFVLKNNTTSLGPKLNIHDRSECLDPNDDIDSQYCLKSAFPIAWLILQSFQRIENKGHTDYSRTSDYNKSFRLQSDAQILQWNQFSNSEIRPFVYGLLSTASQENTRDVTYANRLRKERLKTGLDVLNRELEKKQCLVGNIHTLADICVAIQLMPLLDKNMSTIFPNMKDLQKELFNDGYSFVNKWFANFLSLASVKDTIEAFKNITHDKHLSTEDVLKNNTKEATSNKGNNAKPKSSKQARREKNSKVIEEPSKLKILCIHGYRQNEKMFREKTGAFRKIVGKHADLFFITAPHVVQPLNDEDKNQDQRGWWFSRENDYFKADDISDCDKGFQTSIDIVAEAVRLNGPFNGVIGFSQGSAMTALMILRAALQNVKDKNISVDENIQRRFDEMEIRFPKELMGFQFAILFSGFRSHSSPHSPVYEMIESIQNSSQSSLLDEAMVPTLHVIGKDDKVIGTSMSEDLLSLFAVGKSQSLYHEGGHFVPAGTKTEKPIYVEFLSKMKEHCFEPQ